MTYIRNEKSALDDALDRWVRDTSGREWLTEARAELETLRGELYTAKMTCGRCGQYGDGCQCSREWYMRDGQTMADAPTGTRAVHLPDCRCGCRVPCPCGNPAPHPCSHSYWEAMWGESA